MSRFLMAAWDGAGNLVPTLSLARRLMRRGHDVRVLGHPSIEVRYGNHGWRFVSFRHSAAHDSSIAREGPEDMSHIACNLWFGVSIGDRRARSACAEIHLQTERLGAEAPLQWLGSTSAATWHRPGNL